MQENIYQSKSSSVKESLDPAFLGYAQIKLPLKSTERLFSEQILFTL